LYAHDYRGVFGLGWDFWGATAVDGEVDGDDDYVVARVDGVIHDEENAVVTTAAQDSRNT
jgi:hypothetical protein